MIEFKPTAKKIKESDLVAVERLLGGKLPADIRAHYLKTNGGDAGELVFRDEYTLTDILPIKYPSSYSPSTVESIYEDLAITDKRLPTWLVPLGNEATGDLFCFSVRDKDYGAIYCYMHELEKAKKLTKSFTEFVANLVEEEEIDYGEITDGSDYARQFSCNGSRHFESRDLEALQKSLGTELPKDILAHYEEVNGGCTGEKCVFAHAGHTYTVQEFYPISNAGMGSMTIGELRERMKGRTKLPDWLIVFGVVIPNDPDDDASMSDLAFSIRDKDKGAIYVCATHPDSEAKPFKAANNLRDFVRGLKERDD